jgi:hypothetical protein
MNTNQKAQDAYTAAHQECLDLCERIMETLGDMDAPSDRTNWGHVGNIARTAQQLREVAQFLGMDDPE